MRNLLNKYISKLKGERYEIDPRIPTFYLFRLVIIRIIMKFRGVFSGIRYREIPFIDATVRIRAAKFIVAGKGLTIMRGCYIDAVSSEGIIFGDNVSLAKNVRIECTGNLRFIGKGMKVGNHVGLGADNFFGCAGGIEIGDDTIFGNMVSCHAENHIFSDSNIPVRLQGVERKGIKIGRNCWIGAKVTILDGADIGDNCIVAAGAVLTAGKYEPGAIYGGVPAKLIKHINS